MVASCELATREVRAISVKHHNANFSHDYGSEQSDKEGAENEDEKQNEVEEKIEDEKHDEEDKHDEEETNEQQAADKSDEEASEEEGAMGDEDGASTDHNDRRRRRRRHLHSDDGDSSATTSSSTAAAADASLFDFSEEYSRLHQFLRRAAWRAPVALEAASHVNLINTVSSIAQHYGVGLDVIRSDPEADRLLAEHKRGCLRNDHLV